MRYKKAEKWISELNQKSFASFSDWRLHTLEEAISLIELESKVGLYINLIFNNKQSWIWAVDRVKDAGASGRRVINFNGGSCGPSGIVDITYVRAVRSGQSSQE